MEDRNTLEKTGFYWKEKPVDSGTDSVHSIQDATAKEYLFAYEISNVSSNDKARYESADKFISRIPDFYLLWFQQLLECGMEEVSDLALQTILLIFNNAFTFFRLIKQQLSRRYAGAIGN